MNMKQSILGLVLTLFMLMPFINADRVTTTTDTTSDTIGSIDIVAIDDLEIVDTIDKKCCKKNLCWICEVDDDTTTTLPPTTTTTTLPQIEKTHHYHHTTTTSSTTTTTSTIPIQLERLSWVKQGSEGEFYMYLDWLKLENKFDYSYMYRGVAKPVEKTTGYYILEELTYYPLHGEPQSMELKNIPTGTIVV
jgi:hypothetical protein